MKRFLWILCIFIICLTGCEVAGEKESGNSEIEDSRRLVIYTAYSEEVYKPLIEEFEERTGLWTEVHQGGTLTLLEEMKAGACCDVFLGGAHFLLEENESLFSTVTEHSCTPIVLVYNPKLVKKTPPEGWADLLLPVWKGEIAFADPAKSGSAYMALAGLTEVLSGEEDALRKQFTENLNGNYLEFSRDVVLEVANGNYYIGVTLEETALRSIAQGYDISVVYPEEGILLTEGMAIAKGTARGESAERFIEFMQSADVKRYMEEQLYRHVPEEWEVTR